MILEYKLNIIRGGDIVTPPWVEDGGHLYDPESRTYIGFSPDAANRDYKIPEEVKIFTNNAQVRARAQKTHATYPFQKTQGGGDMSSGEVDTYVDDLITNQDMDGPGVELEKKTSVDANSDRAEIVLVEDTTAPRTITILSADIARKRYKITIKDTDGDASTNNITIATEGSETIDGSATKVISTNYGRVTLYSDGSNLFVKA